MPHMPSKPWERGQRVQWHFVYAEAILTTHYPAGQPASLFHIHKLFAPAKAVLFEPQYLFQSCADKEQQIRWEIRATIEQHRNC